MEKTGSPRKESTDVGGTEGGAKPTGVPPTSGVPNPEVPEKPVRRSFSGPYKLRILEEADRCERGQLGALLRREGLYSSHINTWRRQREEGMLSGLTPKKRGRKAKPKDPLVEEHRRLQRENQRLKAQLEKAETIIGFQKKLSEMLGIPLNPPDSETEE